MGNKTLPTAEREKTEKGGEGMDARFERYIEDLRTVRTLSQPKFSPDMKAKELLETIQSNAIKCFDYMKEDNAIL